MNRLFFTFVFVFAVFNYAYSQTYDYFDKTKEYHYRAVYIDKHGDTITNEKMILKPLGRPWLFQPWLQVAIRYIYHTDTSRYKNYVDPDEFFHEKNQRYYKKKGKFRRIRSNETTGALNNHKEMFFYMHPPRTNQYRMLFYAAHPRINSRKFLTDSMTKYTGKIGIPLMADFWHQYTVTPVKDTVINSEPVKAWSINTTLDVEFKEAWKDTEIYESTFESIYTIKYGFVKMHYTFKDGVKILFDFEKVVYL